MKSFAQWLNEARRVDLRSEFEEKPSSVIVKANPGDIILGNVRVLRKSHIKPENVKTFYLVSHINPRSGDIVAINPMNRKEKIFNIGNLEMITDRFSVSQREQLGIPEGNNIFARLTKHVQRVPSVKKPKFSFGDFVAQRDIETARHNLGIKPKEEFSARERYLNLKGQEMEGKILSSDEKDELVQLKREMDKERKGTVPSMSLNTKANFENLFKKQS